MNQKGETTVTHPIFRHTVMSIERMVTALVQPCFFTPKCLAIIEMKEQPTRKEDWWAEMALRKKSASQ
jgi:hypothetical protein